MGARIRRKVRTSQVAKRESETRRAVVNLHQRIVAIERWIQANAPAGDSATKLTETISETIETRADVLDGTV